MNILLIAKLANHTLNENILIPLLKSIHVTHIYVVRDFPGNLTHEKVTYLCPEKPAKGQMRHVKKFFKGISYCSTYKIDVILGVLITPHGYIGNALSFVTRIPYIHITIAGHREYWLEGKFVEKINIAWFKRANKITVSGKQTETYLLGKGVDPSRIVIMPNLPNAAFLQVDIPIDNPRAYDIVSFSRIDKNKNIDLLLRAVKRIKEICAVKVIIAGDGVELDNMKKMADRLGISNQVEFVGYISEIEDKMKIYANSKIFISCSKGEGFPVSLLEAMSCGCVPVVSNVGDIVDMINQGENGYVFNDTENEKEFTHYLLELLVNKQLLDSMRKEAIKIKTIVSIENKAKMWDTVLSSIGKKR